MANQRKQAKFSWPLWLLFWLCLGLSLLALSYGAFTPQGLRQTLALLHARQELTSQNNQLKNQIDELKWQVLRLRASPLAVEERARQELGLVYPGEQIVLLPH